MDSHLRALQLATRCGGTGRHDVRCQKPDSIQPRFNLTTQRVACSGNQPPPSSMCNIASEQRLRKRC